MRCARIVEDSNILILPSMSAESFAKRLPQNSPGKYYIDWQCLDCDYCREVAPSIFKRDETDGTTYVAKQPQTTEELEYAKESLEGCPCEAIHDDGDQFDWTNSPTADVPAWREGTVPKPKCSHCTEDKKA